MTSFEYDPQDIYYVAKHHRTGEIWVSASGKSKFKREQDLKSAWRTTITKCKTDGIPHVGNATDIEPRRILKPTNSKSKRNPRYMMPSFDQQDIYEIVLQKTETLVKLEKAKEILRLCSGNVPWDIKDQILQFLRGD